MLGVQGGLAMWAARLSMGVKSPTTDAGRQKCDLLRLEGPTVAPRHLVWPMRPIANRRHAASGAIGVTRFVEAIVNQSDVEVGFAGRAVAGEHRYKPKVV